MSVPNLPPEIQWMREPAYHVAQAPLMGGTLVPIPDDLKWMADLEYEVMVIRLFDGDRYLGFHVVAGGDEKSVAWNMNHVVDIIRRASADGATMCHNHPAESSGLYDDRRLWQTISTADSVTAMRARLELAKYSPPIKLHDALVIGRKHAFSVRRAFTNISGQQWTPDGILAYADLMLEGS